MPGNKLIPMVTAAAAASLPESVATEQFFIDVGGMGLSRRTGPGYARQQRRRIGVQLPLRGCVEQAASGPAEQGAGLHGAFLEPRRVR